MLLWLENTSCRYTIITDEEKKINWTSDEHSKIKNLCFIKIEFHANHTVWCSHLKHIVVKTYPIWYITNHFWNCCIMIAIWYENLEASLCCSVNRRPIQYDFCAIMVWFWYCYDTCLMKCKHDIRKGLVLDFYGKRFDPSWFFV